MVRTVTVSLVLNVDGSFDYNAMGEELFAKCEALSDEIRARTALSNAAREALNKRIADAIETVYSVHPSASRTRDTIVYCALRAMKATEEETSNLAKAVKDYLAERTDKDGADTGREFVSNRRGGILRRASLGQTDCVMAPTADVAASDATADAAE